MRRALVFCALAIASATPSIARAQVESGDTVRVHVDGTSELVIDRRLDSVWSSESSGGVWETVCVGACDTRLERTGSYRASGRGIRPSLPIALVPDHDHANLSVNAAYSAGWAGGITMLVIGPIVMLGAAVVFAANSDRPQFETPPCPLDTPCGSFPAQSNTVPIASGLAIGVGAGVIVGGVVAMLTSHHSTIHQRVTATAQRLTIRF